MKVLLDECLPKKLKYELEADEATTVPEAGWASKTNGELLSLAETDFDVFLTRDQNLEYQQNLKRFDVESAKRMTGNSPALRVLGSASEMAKPVKRATENKGFGSLSYTLSSASRTCACRTIRSQR